MVTQVNDVQVMVAVDSLGGIDAEDYIAKLQEQLEEAFPGAHVSVMSRDGMSQYRCYAATDGEGYDRCDEAEERARQIAEDVFSECCR